MKIDRFEVESELGRGGMGVVYRARDPELDRSVAIKRVTAGAAMSPAELLRFRREAEVVARIRHPNVVPIHSLGTHEGRPYYVMDLVEGNTLRDALRGGPLAVEQVVGLLVALGGALEVAHQVGVLHRDLKPANVLLRSRDGAPLLTDFGLAKDLCDTRDRLTCTGEILGTPAYMPPEQINSKRGSASTASDVYGLGATAYAALTGRPPFEGPSPVNVLTAVLEANPVPPRKLNPQVPPGLETIVLRCLEKEPGQRYPGVPELLADLRRFQRGEAIQPRSRAAAIAPFALALSCLALAISAALLYGARPNAPPPPPPPPVEPTPPPTPRTPAQQAQTLEHRGCVAARFLDDQTLVSAGERSLRYWRRANTGDAFTLQAEHPVSDTIRDLRADPDHERLLLANGEGVRYLDARPPFANHSGPVPDSARLTLASGVDHIAYHYNRGTALLASAVGKTLHANWLHTTTGLDGVPLDLPQRITLLEFIGRKRLLVGYGVPGKPAESALSLYLVGDSADRVEKVGQCSEFLVPTAVTRAGPGPGLWVGDSAGTIARVDRELRRLSQLDGALEIDAPVLLAHDAPIRALRELSDGRLISLAGHEHVVDNLIASGQPPRAGPNDGFRLWSAAGVLLSDHPHPRAKEVELSDLDVSPDERQLAIVVAGRGVELHPTPAPPTQDGLPETLSLLKTVALEGCRGVLLPNRETLLSGGKDGVRRWRIGPGGKLTPEDELLFEGRVDALTLHDGRVFVATRDGRVHALHLSGKASPFEQPLQVEGVGKTRPFGIRHMVFNAEGSELAVSLNELVLRFELPSGKPKPLVRAPHTVMALGYEQLSGELLIAHGGRTTESEGQHGMMLIDPRTHAHRKGELLTRVNAILPSRRGGWWIGDQAQVVTRLTAFQPVPSFGERLEDAKHSYTDRGSLATRSPSHDRPVRFLARLPGKRMLSLAARGEGDSELHVWGPAGELLADHHNARRPHPVHYSHAHVSPCGRMLAVIDRLEHGFELWSLPPAPR